jgi:hypothetical protein
MRDWLFVEESESSVFFRVRQRKYDSLIRVGVAWIAATVCLFFTLQDYLFEPVYRDFNSGPSAGMMALRGVATVVGAVLAAGALLVSLFVVPATHRCRSLVAFRIDKSSLTFLRKPRRSTPDTAALAEVSHLFVDPVFDLGTAPPHAVHVVSRTPTPAVLSRIRRPVGFMGRLVLGKSNYAVKFGWKGEVCICAEALSRSEAEHLLRLLKPFL